MGVRNLLVHLDSGERSRERLALAVVLARRSGARLTGLFAESDTIGASLVGRRSPQQMARAVERARELLDAASAEAGVTASWLQVDPGEYADVVGWTVVCSRYFDLCVFGQHDPGQGAGLPADAVERVIVEGGRPALVVPFAGRFPDVGRRVLVAWTGSREAARAVNDAMPLLEAADHVVLLSIQAPPRGKGATASPELDVIEHLRAHGVEATRDRAFVDELSVRDTVLNRAAETAADLVVMGAHGSRGIASLHLNSTTRDVLRTMTVPLLLAR